MIVLTATNTFGRQEYRTALEPAKFRDIKIAAWANKMDQDKQYCIIYDPTLTAKEMENICLVAYEYICFVSTVPDYTDYQRQETEMILRKLDPPPENITKGMPWIAQTWPEVQQSLLIGIIYIMGQQSL